MWWVKWLVLPLVFALLGDFSFGVYQNLKAAYFGTVFDAARFGSVRRLGEFQSQGVSLSKITDPMTGDTLLHIASDAETIHFLVQEGVDINAPNSEGLSPLSRMLRHHVDDFGCYEHLLALLTNGASLTPVQKETGFPPLVLVWRNWHSTLSRHRHNITRLLLDVGADPTAQDVNGTTALHHIMQHAPSQASTALVQMLRATIDSLLYAPSPHRDKDRWLVNLPDDKGATPLITLIRATSPFSSNMATAHALVRQLLVHGANVYAHDIVGGDALCYAAFQGLSGLLGWLLDEVAPSSASVGSAASATTSSITQLSPQAVSCAVLSPAYDMNFKPSGVLSLLTRHGFQVSKHHVELFMFVWGLKTATSDEASAFLSPLEVHLMQENKRYQRHHRPDEQVLGDIQHQLDSMVGLGGESSSSLRTQNPQTM